MFSLNTLSQCCQGFNFSSAWKQKESDSTQNRNGNRRKTRNRFNLFGALKTGLGMLTGGMKLLGQSEYNKGRQRGAQVGLLSQVL